MNPGNKTILLTLMVLLIPISGVGIDVFVPSMPAISAHFDASHFLTKQAISIYLAGFALGQVITGVLSDSYGRRPVLLVGLILFSLASFASVFSTSIDTFLLTRFFQGLFVTAPVVIAKAMTTDTFSAEEIKRVSTYLVLAWSIGPIIAPEIGGQLQTYFGWQGSFYFLCLAAFLLAVVVFCYLPETNQEKRLFSVNRIIKD